MTDTEINIAIAEACGWKWVENHCFRNESFMGSKAYGDGWKNPKTKQVSDDPNELPDYTTDLNAMHEVEKVLTSDQRVAYARNLHKICFDEAIFQQPWHATAGQRAEAFLRTIGKWKE